MKRGKAGNLKPKPKNQTSFEFVNAIPSTAAETAKTRSLVRANATKYQWRQAKESATPAALSQNGPDDELPAENGMFEQELDLGVLPKSHVGDGEARPIITKADSAPSVVHSHDLKNPADKISRSLAPRRIRHSKDDRGEIPWLGFAFPMEWESAPLTSNGSKLGNPDPSWMARPWGPTSFLGAGKVDPFHAYPSILPGESVGRLIDHTVGLVLPRLLPSASDRLKNPAVGWWLPRAISSKALFHAFMYGAASYVHVYRGLLHKQSSPEMQISYADTIRELSKEMRDPVTACTDENILAIVIMGHNQGLGLVRPRSGKLPSQAPLKGLQSLDVYGQMSIAREHILGMIKLVEMRGGLENIQMEGLAVCISFAGVLGATRELKRPFFPFIPILGASDNRSTPRSSSLGKEPDPVLASLGRGFLVLSQTSNTSPLVSNLLVVLRRMTDYTRVVDDYAQDRLMHIDLTALIDQRNGTQHALMSLPAAHGHLPDPRIEEPLYEACRLAGIIYSIIVVFPYPAPTAPFLELETKLKEELSRWDIRQDWQRAPDLLLWILMMGGIAAIGLPERRWYVEETSRLMKMMEIKTGRALKKVMQEFLWLGSTSDADGMEIWSEVLQFRLDRLSE